jgi:uncharacterized protein (TIGR04141 family)
MPRRPRRRLAVYLLKDGTDPAGALNEPNKLEYHHVTGLGSTDALVVKGNPTRVPAWASWLDGHVDGSLLGLKTASAGAVLLVTAGRRLFAVTFGQGRHLLDHELVVPDFGLRVVLNTVAADQLKSVDVRTIDETTMHTRRDLSRDSSLSAFGLDVTRDLLSAVTGRPRDPTLAHRLTGADSLMLQAETSVPELPTLLDRLLGAYAATDYRTNFEFIDHLGAEKNPAQLARLDAKLISDLGTRAITDAHLAAPETLDWQDLEGFRFSFGGRSAPISADPSIRSYLDARNGRTIDIKLLKTDKLMAVRASRDEVMAQWSIYRCLVYQVELDDALFVLSAGQWFRVDLQYRRRLEARVDALPKRDGLPAADAGSTEADYNAKAAGALDAAPSLVAQAALHACAVTASHLNRCLLSEVGRSGATMRSRLAVRMVRSPRPRARSTGSTRAGRGGGGEAGRPAQRHVPCALCPGPWAQGPGLTPIY